MILLREQKVLGSRRGRCISDTGSSSSRSRTQTSNHPVEQQHRLPSTAVTVSDNILPSTLPVSEATSIDGAHGDINSYVQGLPILDHTDIHTGSIHPKLVCLLKNMNFPTSPLLPQQIRRRQSSKARSNLHTHQPQRKGQRTTAIFSPLSTSRLPSCMSFIPTIRTLNSCPRVSI